jgi:glycosyltransferase involved in cell wall biosynthesis
MTDISVVMNAHREGLLIGPSINSFEQAIEFARSKGLKIEPIIILDCSDDFTKNMFLGCNYNLVNVEHSNLSLSRNTGVEIAKGDCIAFLDADDLWGENWLHSSFEFCCSLKRPVIAHAECVQVFGDTKDLWFHVDSESSDFDINFLRIENCWQSLSFGARQIYLDHPYAPIDFNSGLGYEDWHWNCCTIASGIAHKPVPGTVHAVRRRRNSLSQISSNRDIVIRQNELSDYSWRPNKRGH